MLDLLPLGVAVVLVVLVYWRAPERIARAIVEPLGRELEQLRMTIGRVAESHDARLEALDARLRRCEGSLGAVDQGSV